METKEKTKFVDKIVEAMRNGATGIEEMQLQAALGKAEARDKFEEVKKKFDLFLHESKVKAKAGKEKVDDLHTKFDVLRVQLALGKAETKEKFQQQKKNLLLALHELEVKIKTNEEFSHYYALLLIEIEIFKLQLEILDAKYKKGKESAFKSFEKRKQEFNEFVKQFKTKHSKKEETKWEHFNGEISEAFTHFKNAFSKA